MYNLLLVAIIEGALKDLVRRASETSGRNSFTVPLLFQDKVCHEIFSKIAIVKPNNQIHKKITILRYSVVRKVILLYSGVSLITCVKKNTNILTRGVVKFRLRASFTPSGTNN